jgi:hypothetical protein
MSKIGITTGTAIALSVIATVLSCQPSYASDPLLAKAQAEFTAKARDAVLQRRAAQAPAGMVLASAPQSEPVQTPKASPEQPAALSAPASADRSIPERTATAPAQAATIEVVETPVVVAKLPEAPAPVVSETKADEVQPESKPLPTETEVEHILAPKQPELPQAAAPQAVTPNTNTVAPATTAAAPATNTAAPATVKTQKETREQARTAQTKKTARRHERDFSGERLPYDMETLRARAPEVAAAIARYM